MRLYPTIQPDMTVGEYLDTLEYQIRHTDSDDAEVEAFWGSVVKTQDAILAEPLTAWEIFRRNDNNFTAQIVGGSPFSKTIEVKYIPSSLVITIQPWGRVIQGTEWGHER